MIIKIECDRRIKKLNIEFGEGDSEEIEYSEVHETFDESNDTPKRKKSESKKASRLLDLDDTEVQEVQQEIIEKPHIEEVERPVMVAEDMQNLSF